ncbi:hypothetical protein ACFL1N_12840 [Thermodesulfobacteriota bacterium]
MYLTPSKKIARSLDKHLCGPIYYFPSSGLKALLLRYIFKFIGLLAIKKITELFINYGLVNISLINNLHKISRNFHKLQDAIFIGFGRHASGEKAVKEAERYNAKWLLLEDGFIRSVGLGSDGEITSSLVVDDVGIYYDSRSPSKIENLLNYDENLNGVDDINLAQEAIDLIKNNNITKYNHAEDIPPDYFPRNNRRRVLVVDQTKNDLSIIYGNPNSYTFNDILESVIQENTGDDIYVKLHPESISGYKGANFSIESLKKHNIHPITEQYNIISILKEMDSVYVMSSQVGLEALILDKHVVCFGTPFYAGWGLTDDRSEIKRRYRKRILIELFIATYIKYTVFINTETGERCDVTDAIRQIIKKKPSYGQVINH